MQQGAYPPQKKEVEEEKKNVYKPSIQERIREQVSVNQMEEIEEWLDGWITDPKSFDQRV